MNSYPEKLNCAGCKLLWSLLETGPTLGRFSPRWCRNSSAACQGSVSAICSLGIIWKRMFLVRVNLEVGMHKVEHHNAVLAPIVAHGHTLRRKSDKAHEERAWALEHRVYTSMRVPGKALFHHLEGSFHHLCHVGVGSVLQELLHLLPGILRRVWVKLDRLQLLHVGPGPWNLLLKLPFQCHLRSVMLPAPGRIRTKRNVGVILH